jgi:hypothetical protein
MPKRCTKSGIATFYGSLACQTLRSIHILGKSTGDLMPAAVLRDVFSASMRQNIAQNPESQLFTAHWHVKRCMASRYWKNIGKAFP